MTKILLSAFVLFFSLTSFATKPTKNYLTDKYMKMINLEGLEITGSEGSEFFYKIVKSEKVTKEVKAVLEEETQTRIMSEVHALGEPSSFENIYVFVGKVLADSASDYQYVLNVVYVNGSDSMATVDYDIVKATPKVLSLQNGTTGSITNSKATIKDGTFFPY